MEKLPGFGIGRHGQLMEWREDYDEWEIGHRHFSHLYPIFPSNQINQYENQDFLEAGKKSLERRMEYGGGHTGWSCAWLVNLYARFGDGNSAVKYIYHLLGKLTAPNLFDLHPPPGKDSRHSLGIPDRREFGRRLWNCTDAAAEPSG